MLTTSLVDPLDRVVITIKIIMPQGRSQDFHKGGAQLDHRWLDGVVISSPQQSRACFAGHRGWMWEGDVPPKAEAFGILAEQLPNFY